MSDRVGHHRGELAVLAIGGHFSGKRRNDTTGLKEAKRLGGTCQFPATRLHRAVIEVERLDSVLSSHKHVGAIITLRAFAAKIHNTATSKTGWNPGRDRKIRAFGVRRKLFQL